MPVIAFQARNRLAENHPDIATAKVRPIPLADARAVIERHEWLGTMPAVARYAFGLFFGDRLGGAVVYGDEYAENRGVWDRYGFTGRVIALLRGACLPWAHPHAASKLIRGVDGAAARALPCGHCDLLQGRRRSRYDISSCWL
jgi:hypothetical protein